MTLIPAPDHIDEIVASYLAGEATPGQVAFLEKWKAENDDNLRYFEQLSAIFKKAASPSSADNFNTDRAWQKLKAKLPDRVEAKTVPLYSGYRFFMRIAAGIIILVTVGFFTYHFFKTHAVEPVQIFAEKTTESDTLPDGSGVFLNRQTKIEYSFDEEGDAHLAILVGEAYFNVDHDIDKTFIVEAAGTFIRDIGTSFNVKAYPDSSTVEVVVEEGEVMFYTKGDTGIYLKTGGKGTYHKQTKTFTVGDPEPNVTAYKTKSFTFTNQSLESVVKTLNGVYKEKIRINDSLRQCKLTVSFDDEDPDMIAAIIAETLGLSVSRFGEVITLKGPGCGQGTP